MEHATNQALDGYVLGERTAASMMGMDTNESVRITENMRVERYRDQRPRWPVSGRHILAQYDDRNIVVYQAYSPSIGRYAVDRQHFGGDFSYARMSWIKPNFLWMMYRCGWGTKEGQETVLAVTIPRVLFDEMLAVAVASTFSPDLHLDRESWKSALSRSTVRLQWDPDHGPTGEPQARRAIQLGLRGPMLQRYGKDEVVSIADISEFVAQQRRRALERSEYLLTPREDVYLPDREDAWRSVGLQSIKPPSGRSN